jgi:hypothetical protein
MQYAIKTHGEWSYNSIILDLGTVCLSMALQPFVGPWPPFQFLNLFTQSVGLLGRESAHRTTQTQNKRTQTSMPQVGFEPKTRVFERAKTIHALNRAVTVKGFDLGTRRK